jgi:hypothetical protein
MKLSNARKWGLLQNYLMSARKMTAQKLPGLAKH